jgi:DNA-binding CsgD family transcriptional regulator
VLVSQLPLTERELEVLRAYVRAGSTKAAAYELGLSQHTVKAHLARARERAGVDATVQLVDLVARRKGEP